MTRVEVCLAGLGTAVKGHIKVSGEASYKMRNKSEKGSVREVIVRGGMRYLRILIKREGKLTGF
jgi:hypothetical protein